MIEIHMGNARSKLQGADEGTFKLLQHECSFMTGEPGTRVTMDSQGETRSWYWDGYRSLITRAGSFPSGLVPRVSRLLQKWRVAYQLYDHREVPIEGAPRWSWPEGFQLRDYQERAVRTALRVGRGVIDSPPRTGKTVMMAELIRHVADRTVITSPTRAVAEQTCERLLEYFCSHETGWSVDKRTAAEDFYLLTGEPQSNKAKKAFQKATVIVTTADSAKSLSKPWWQGVKALIVDERHHQAALKTYGKINDLAANAYWRWGMTGTNYRSDPGEQVALEACLGNVVASYSIREMIDRGVLVPARCEMWTVPQCGLSRAPYRDARERGLIHGGPRNAMIRAAVERLVHAGRRVLVLVHEIEHGEVLAQMIPGSRFVQAADGRDVRAAVGELDRGELRCLIGSPVVGEGLDCPAADALVYAKGMKARVTHTQDVFRVLTGHPGKHDALIIDFNDRHSKSLLDHAVERMKNYVSIGVHVRIEEKAVDVRQQDLLSV